MTITMLQEPTNEGSVDIFFSVYPCSARRETILTVCIYLDQWTVCVGLTGRIKLNSTRVENWSESIGSIVRSSDRLEVESTIAQSSSSFEVETSFNWEEKLDYSDIFQRSASAAVVVVAVEAFVICRCWDKNQNKCLSTTCVYIPSLHAAFSRAGIVTSHRIRVCVFSSPCSLVSLSLKDQRSNVDARPCKQAFDRTTAADVHYMPLY